MKLTIECSNPGDISDGYHTFNELYAHRCLLYINLCLMQPEKCAWKEDQGFGEWICLYLDSEFGQMSYHVPIKYSYLLENKIKYDPDHKWDGHTSENVLSRLTLLANEKT